MQTVHWIMAMPLKLQASVWQSCAPDAWVNVVVQDLYAKYPDVAARQPQSRSDRSHCTSLRPWKSKAWDISACMRILHEQYHDKVPEDFNALL